MNPLEILRYIAGLDDESPEHVVAASLDSLSVLSAQPELLFVALKRLLLAHPRNGLLWWVANKILLSIDIESELLEIKTVLSNDVTLDALTEELENGTVLFFLDENRGFQDVQTPKLTRRSLQASLARLERRGPINYFDPIHPFTQLLAKAHPRDLSAVVIEPTSFSNGYVVIASEVASIADRVLVEGVRVICRVPVGFELPKLLFEAQVNVLVKDCDSSDRFLCDDLTELGALPGFRANPELVTLVMGNRGGNRSDRVASELLLI